MEFDDLSYRVIGCALAVHRELGPGLLESVYEQCLAYELRQQGIEFCTQVPMPVRYRGVEIDCGYRLDLVVSNQLVVELKAVSEILPIHEAQLLTYMKLSKISIGLLMNFNSCVLKEAIKRLVL